MHSTQGNQKVAAGLQLREQKDFGNIEDDDIVNQNSSHDGRSRMEIDLTHSTLINEHAGSPLVGAESALMLQEETKKSKQVEKATQMSDATRLRKSTESSVKKLDGP